MAACANSQSIYLLIVASIFGALSVSPAILVHAYWPFSERAVRRSLEDATSATVSFERFHEFELRNLEGSGQTSFRAVFGNPIPRGLIRTSGQFGPWNSPHPNQTAVIRGTYSRPDFALD